MSSGYFGKGPVIFTWSVRSIAASSNGAIGDWGAPVSSSNRTERILWESSSVWDKGGGDLMPRSPRRPVHP
eukprot:2837979-Prymnesium_polylepis.1